MILVLETYMSEQHNRKQRKTTMPKILGKATVLGKVGINYINVSRNLEPEYNTSTCHVNMCVVVSAECWYKFNTNKGIDHYLMGFSAPRKARWFK